MKITGSMNSILGLCMLACILFASPVANAQNDGTLSFQWAFAALTGPDTDRKLTQVTRDTVLKSGDQFKMMIELNKKGFIYVLYGGSNGEITKLFPNNTDSESVATQIGERHYLPGGNLWFKLDDQVGLETFHLLASKTPLVELEDLLLKYEHAGAQEKPALAKEIRNLIKQKRKEKRQLAAAVAERPIGLGGNFRSASSGPLVSQDISIFAVDISGSEFFARTFTIEHK